MCALTTRLTALPFLPLLFMLTTLLPPTEALFNFGVDLYYDLKGRAPFGGGPLLTPLTIAACVCAALIGQYGFLPIRISDAVTSLRRFRQLTRTRRLRRHLHPSTLDRLIQALDTLESAMQRYGGHTLD